MDYIKQHYDLPFLRRGMRIEVDGKKGTIEKEKNAHLLIHFDDGKKAPVHPTWETAYFNSDGAVIKDFRKIKEPAQFIDTGKSECLVSVLDNGACRTNIQITPNLFLNYIQENNSDDDKLIAVVCDFKFFNQDVTAYIIVENIQTDQPRYGMIESEDEIHDSIVSSLNNINVLEKLTPILQEYKTKWEEIQKLPF